MSGSEDGRGAGGGPSEALSRDAFLDGRLRLYQPVDGYRAAIDPVLLAAAVEAGPEEDDVVELGSGVGTASLCLAVRQPGCRGLGFDRDAGLVALARRNAADNGLAERVRFEPGDVRTVRIGCAVVPPGSAWLMMNPPYLEAGRHTPSPHPGKRQADAEETGATLTDWLAAAARLLRPRGRLVLIHRADRLDQVMAGLAGWGFGAVTLFPLWPRAGAPAGRILVQARLAVRSPARLLPGLVLHEADGSFTEAADAVLRHAQPIRLSDRAQTQR